MVNQCHICDQIFVSKEKLYEHLETHAKLGMSVLSDEEVMEQFKSTKSGEPARMASKK
jgi:hypothetical protein